MICTGDVNGTTLNAQSLVKNEEERQSTGWSVCQQLNCLVSQALSESPFALKEFPYLVRLAVLTPSLTTLLTSIGVSKSYTSSSFASTCLMTLS